MNKKGFTLIELLAVIVVLGIIMLIAVTAVSGVINSSKVNSFKASAVIVANQVRSEALIMEYTNNQTIDCLNGNYGLNLNNYDYCSANITVINDVVKVYVDLVGKGNFNGFSVIGATMDSANIINNTTYQSLKTVLLTTVGTNDIDVNKYNGNGIYKWGDKYIFRGGITKTNSAGLKDVRNFNNDVDSGTNPNNYIKVPWESYSEGEDCSNLTTNKCWRIISINIDGSITIVRDRNESNQVFDNAHNTDASTAYGTTEIGYGYNDLLGNIYSLGHPEEYRQTSLMYNKLYGTSGYQNTILKNYYGILNTIDICLNKINNYVGINNTAYLTTTFVTDTCNVAGKPYTTSVGSFKNQYVRLPYVEENLNASLESTCTENYQNQCRSQNFMYIKDNYWVQNGYSTSSWLMSFVNMYGSASNITAYNSYGVRPVVNLKSTVLISEGTGSPTDPYIIKS